MNNSEKYFKNELALITDEELREKTAFFLDEVAPDYFWEIPASSSGKYHPAFALGEGGLVRHTKMCVRVLLDLIEQDPTQFFNIYSPYKDYIIVAMLIHDCFKNGINNSGKTVKNHPLICSIFAQSFFDGNSDIYMSIESHMGRFGDVNYGYETTDIVHRADYIASRKYITYDPIYYEVN